MRLDLSIFQIYASIHDTYGKYAQKLEVPTTNSWGGGYFRSGLLPVCPEKNYQMSIKVAQKWFH